MALRVDSPLSPEVDRVVSQAIGCAITVHRVLGPGYAESVYENALTIELTKQGLEFNRQMAVRVIYDGQTVGEGKTDIVVAGCVLLELKTVEELTKLHHAQVRSYLKATNLPIGLLINFNSPVLVDGLRRIIA